MGEQGGLNLYGFCFNDSINLWDFLGMVVTTNPSIFAQNVFNRNVPVPYIAPGLFGGYDTSWLSFNWSTGAYNVTKNTQSFGDPRSGYTIYKGVQLPNIVWNGTPDQRNAARTAVDQFLNGLANNALTMTVAPQTPAHIPTISAVVPPRPFEWTGNALLALGADVVTQSLIGWSNIGFHSGADNAGYRYQQVGAFTVRQSIGDATGVDVNDPAFLLQSAGWSFVMNAGVLKSVSRIGQYGDNFMGPVAGDIAFARNLRNSTVGELNEMIRDQRGLLQQLLGGDEGGLGGARSAYADPRVPGGLTRESLHVYSEIASRQINSGGDLNGVQTVRLMTIEKVLGNWGTYGPP